jgi:hypothetical protein
MVGSDLHEAITTAKSGFTAGCHTSECHYSHHWESIQDGEAVKVVESTLWLHILREHAKK